jgi:putative glutamine amidotransferase
MSASHRPLVAVTAWRRHLPTYLGQETDLYTLGVEYADALSAAGLIPLVLTEMDHHDLAHVLQVVDGLVLSGGEDVQSGSRDGLEMDLLRLARGRTPTLGICRGMQIANVGLGGTLIDDLPESPDHPAATDDQLAARHPITIAAQWLQESFGSSAPTVNSIHHQALDRVADALRPVAWAADGTVEAVESAQDDWFFRGVQWHPEKMDGPGEAAHRMAIFAQFATAVRAYSHR